MGELAEINIFPLTGARAVSEEAALMTPGGLEGDRRYVLFDRSSWVNEPSYVPAHESGTGRGIYSGGSHPRLSQKECPELAQLVATEGEDGNLKIQHEHPNMGYIIISKGLKYNRGKVVVDEFGEATPAVDVGDPAAQYFSLILDDTAVHRHIEPRLARKTNRWTEADGAGVTPPAERKVAPLHIISSDSVSYLQELEEAEGMDFGGERFRANLVVSGFKPFAENGWLGKILRVGDVDIQITRTTERCAVPGRDQFTGENKKDLPKLYPLLRNGGKPIFGVYGVPILRNGQKKPIIHLQDDAEILEL